MRLSDRVVVITGSTRGIGRAIALACAREGAAVVVSSRTEEDVEATVGDLAGEGLRASGIRADVTNTADLQALLDHAVERWGRVDVWVNNAGISGGFRPLHAFTNDDIERVVHTNLTAVLQACKLVIPYLIDHGGGIVINLSGKGGRGEASPYMTPYAATKAAVTSLSKSLAQEYSQYPVSIYSAMPGMVRTSMFDDVKASPETQETIEALPYVFDAIGVGLDEVGPFFAGIAAREPGKETGKQYSLLRGSRLARGILKLIYYRMTGKIRG